MMNVTTSLVAAAIFAFLPLDGKTEPGANARRSAAGTDSKALIQDRAGFFSDEAEAEALQAIERLRRDEGVEVRVETFDSVPSEKAANVGDMPARERAEFFANWLKELARERQAKGVLILICKEPSHLRVGISKELYRRGFGDQQRSEINERLLRGFRQKEYDRGLSDTIAYIQSTADRATEPGAAAAPAGREGRRPAPRAQEGIGSGLGGWLCVGLVGFMIVMLVMSVIRMFRRPQMAPGGYGQYGHPAHGPQGYGGQYNQPGYGGYGAPGGGLGGGMFGGLMSGLGGALLGNWLYGRYAGGGSQPGAGSGPMSPGAGAGPMHDDTRYQDFTSSGGDFGDSAGGDWGGGGDYGGGDFGGGDDGGGDF